MSKQNGRVLSYKRRSDLAPVAIALPDGLGVSGITMWAVRLAKGLAADGRAVTLIVHEEPAGVVPVDAGLEPPPPGVEVVHITGPGMRQRPGDLTPFVALYHEAMHGLAVRTGWIGPVVFCPTLLGDCFGIGAAIAQAQPESIRIVGWQHSDIAYDTQVLAHYEAAISRFVAVSARIASTLRERLPNRRSDVEQIPYGVPCAPIPPTARDGGPIGPRRPLRLVYTGRLEHNQKRVTALVALSDELARRGVPHTLTLAGHGPAAEEIGAMIASPAAPGRAGRIRRVGALSAEGVTELLDASDAFVLASRYEGLSVAMLEAMARGCVPIVTRVESGADEAVRDGVNGFFAGAVGDDAETDDEGVACALADAVGRFVGLSASARAEVSLAAWRTVRDRFSVERHCAQVARLIDEAAASPPRPWPEDRPCAFSGATEGGGSGTVPPDGALQLGGVLDRLAGRRVVIHGAGRHTIELAAVLEASPAEVIAIADDDRGRWGSTLGRWPIIAPGRAGAEPFRATDVVISSWLHEDSIWRRRGVYERQGLRVHRVYG